MTVASRHIASPTLTGRKKSTESVDAVTICLRACLVAEIAATSSICAINLPPNKVPYALASGGKICAVLTVLEFELGFFSIVISHYNIGDNNLDIDSLNLIHNERCSYKLFVICVDSLISSLNIVTNSCAISTSYKKAFTSKFKWKLLTSIFAVPTDDT